MSRRLRLILLPLALVSAAPALAAQPRVTQDAAADAIARSALGPDHGTLQRRAVWTRGNARVYDFAQTYAGYPVWQRGVSATVGSDGAVRHRPQTATRFGPSVPTVDTTRAANIASVPGRVTFRADEAVTVWLPLASEARLVHAFYRAQPGLPFAPLVLVDAVEGDVLLRVNMVRFDRQATIHELNPVVTPTPTLVTLSALDPGATQLTTPAITVVNCLDKGEVSSGQFSIRKCTFEQTATADAQGDFPQTYTADDELEDAYAEVAMFHHVTKAHAFFTGLGLTGLNSTPLTAIVNVRMPAGYAEGDFKKMTDPSLPLEPMNNAFFTPQPPFGKSVGPDGGSLWFGQGHIRDFSYDGDVVVHEFGHAVVDATLDLVPFFQLDTYGAWPAAGAMNEGLADYFSAALQGDSKIGEYAAQSFVEEGADSIRDLTNDHRCPNNVAGESHIDSTMFSGALWSVRNGLTVADRGTFDQAVFAAMLSAPSGDIDFAKFSEILRAELESSALGADTAKAFEAEVTARGLFPECARVLEVDKNPISGPSSRYANAFVAPGFDYVPAPPNANFVPGVMQFHRKLPTGTTRLKVFWEHRDSPSDFGGSPFSPALLVRFGDTPIALEYGSDVSSNADLVEVSPAGSSYSADIPVDGATDVYVMIVNRGETGALYRELSLVPITPAPPPVNTGGTGGSPPLLVTGGSSGAPRLHPAGGCGVGTPHSSSPTAWMSALLLGLLVARGRRRAGRS